MENTYCPSVASYQKAVGSSFERMEKMPPLTRSTIGMLGSMSKGPWVPPKPQRLVLALMMMLSETARRALSVTTALLMVFDMVPLE